MIKNKHPLYYVGLVIVLIAIFKYYGEYKSYKEENKTEEQKRNEGKVLDIDLDLDFKSGKFMQSLSEVVSSIKEVNDEAKTISAKNTESIKSLFVSYSKFDGKPSQIGLCSNYYNIEIEGYAEDRTVLIAKQAISSLKFKEYPEFYNILNRALTLTAKGQRMEIFAQDLSNFPKIFTDSKSLKLNQSGLLLITVTDILGATKFNPANIKSKIILEMKDRNRANFKFFCKETVEVKYTISDTSGKILEKEKIETITLGSAKNKREELLEYLILNSYNGSIDAVIPSSYFMKKSKIKNITIKGTIIKKGE